jgi:hypothetical protein
VVKRCTEDFLDWVQRVDQRFQGYAHARVIARVLQAVADGEVRRVMIFCPPRHG